MARNSWHILHGDGDVTLARRVPVRWDVSVAVHLAEARPVRLAHQVRQDVWRALRGQRGFAPLVSVRANDDGVTVRAGGQVDGLFDRRVLEGRLAAVLKAPENQARWLRFARKHGQVNAASPDANRSLQAEEGAR